MLALLFAYVKYKPTLTVGDDCRRGAGVELEVLLEFQVVLLVDEIDRAVSQNLHLSIQVHRYRQQLWCLMKDYFFFEFMKDISPFSGPLISLF